MIVWSSYEGDKNSSFIGMLKAKYPIKGIDIIQL